MKISGDMLEEPISMSSEFQTISPPVETCTPQKSPAKTAQMTFSVAQPVGIVRPVPPATAIPRPRRPFPPVPWLRAMERARRAERKERVRCGQTRPHRVDREEEVLSSLAFRWGLSWVIIRVAKKAPSSILVLSNGICSTTIATILAN